MAGHIARRASGYGNPWLLTYGQWRRILDILPDLEPANDHMAVAKAISRSSKRRERRLQIIR